MHTLSTLFAVLTVYCGSLLVAAWSFTGFNLEPTTGFGSPVAATVAPATTKRATPVTRWRPAIRERGYDYAHDDTFDLGDEVEAEPAPAPAAPPAPRRIVGYEAAKGTRL